MTIEVEGSRRSQRIRDLKSSQSVVYDDEIDKSGYEESEEEVDDADDPDVRTGKRVKRSKGPSKRAKKAGFNELRQEFKEDPLFQTLIDSEASINELSNDWIDQYKSNKDSAKKNLVNLILNIVGCFTKIEEHDVNNNESASDTVGEIQTFFKKQKIHEFYLLSKKPEFKHLKKNYLQFLNEIISISNENGLLFENVVLDDEETDENNDESNIMEDLLIWLSAFSVSSIRSLRFISTLSLYSIELTLCKIIKNNNSSLEKFKHQLNVESNKKKSKKRIESIEKNIDTFNNQSIILENFIQDIVNTTFIHRFKDVDHLIRSESMIYLGDWMGSYPEFFFKVTFLKYLGWVLSDSNSSVRLQVIKTLIKLLKHQNFVSGLRQFLERFKGRIIEISFYDVDNNVKLNALQLLNEINKSGFLETDEINKILSLIYEKNIDKKFYLQLLNFVQIVENENSKEVIDSLNLNELKKFPYNAKNLIKINSLIKIFNDSIDKKFNEFFTKNLFNNYNDIGELLIQYYLLDISSINGFGSFKDLIKLSNDDEIILLSLINGYLLYLNDKNEEILNKTRINEVENNNESVISRIIDYLPKILEKIENNELKFKIFLNIFQSLKFNYFESSTNESNCFKLINNKILDYFKKNIIENLKSEFIQLFKNLNNNNNNSSMITEILSSYKNLTNGLIIEFTNYLKSPNFELINPNYDEIYQDYLSKLLVLGLNFNITELLNNFKLINDNLLVYLTNIDIDKNLKFIYLFKLLISSTSWKLNNLLNSNEIYDLETELKFIPDLLDSFNEILNNEHFKIDIKSEISLILIDLLILLFNFFKTYRDLYKTNISNVNRFKELELNDLKLSEEVLASLKLIFLSKESILSNFLNIEIERNENEDVNLNSLTFENNDDLNDDEIKWELEKNLIIFTKKLLTLKKIDLIKNDFYDRIILNKNILGDLFKSIIEEEEEEEEEEKEIIEKPTRASKPKAKNPIPSFDFGEDEIFEENHELLNNPDKIPDIPMDDD